MNPEALILTLRQLAGQLPADEFPGRVLALLETVLPFDSGTWAIGTTVDGLPILHEHHDHRMPQGWLAEFHPAAHRELLDTLRA